MTDDTTIDFEKQSELAADFIEGFLDVAELDGDIENGVEDSRPFVRIVYEDDNKNANFLIGKYGSTLQGLQTLTRLAVKKASGEYSKVTVDIAGYLDKQKDKLIEHANKVIANWKEGEKEFCFRPMNSYDRRLVHQHILGIDGFTTVSEGQEPERYLKLIKE